MKHRTPAKHTAETAPEIPADFLQLCREEFVYPNPWITRVGWGLFVFGTLLQIASFQSWGIFGIPFILPLAIMLGIDARRIGCNDLRFTILDTRNIERSGALRWMFSFMMPPVNVFYIWFYLRYRNDLAFKAFVTRAGDFYVSESERKAILRRIWVGNTIGIMLVLIAAGLLAWIIYLIFILEG